MGLQKLVVHDVRNIAEQVLLPSPGLNFIYGKNASGKSALLEAIFLLGRAKSFRTASIRQVIRFGQNQLIVYGVVEPYDGYPQSLGVQMDGKVATIHVNHQGACKRTDLAYALPLQIIHPKSFELLDAGAQIRREFLDWGIFNEEGKFLRHWRKYKKALAQRNALLKAKEKNQLPIWNQELATYGTIVDSYRERYLQRLKPFVIDLTNHFLNLDDITFKVVSGWDNKNTLLENLQLDEERDLRDGFTHSGPHRGDFLLFVGAKLAKDVVSRGQLKLLVMCLKLAQVELMHQERNDFGCVLIDDFAAELDKDNRIKILNNLNNTQCQVFVTATELEDFGELAKFNGYKVFNVEQGEIKADDVSRET